MSVFKSYEKVERIEKEECDGILNGVCAVFEKIDGANGQLYRDASGEVAYGSRNQVLGIGPKSLTDQSFRGFGEWVLDNYEPLKAFFTRFPEITVYGEWLVSHKVKYAPEFYKQFYAFDLYDNERHVCHPFSAAAARYWFAYPGPIVKEDAGMFSAAAAAARYWFAYPGPIVKEDAGILNPTIEDLKRFLDLKSNFGADYREGIVVKNYDFINKWGRNTYGKILHETFTEVKSIKNPMPCDVETAIAEAYCTKARVDKICYKIKYLEACKGSNVSTEASVSDDMKVMRLEMKHIPQVINMTLYDIITEDMSDILKKYRFPIINFNTLKRLVFDQAKKHYNKFLEEQMS